MYIYISQAREGGHNRLWSSLLMSLYIQARMNVQKIRFSFVLSKPNVTWFARFEWDRSLLVQLSQPSQAQAKPSLVYCGTINIPGVFRHYMLRTLVLVNKSLWFKRLNNLFARTNCHSPAKLKPSLV